MGREIRRVPPTWKHPRDGRGNFIPLYDEPFKDAAIRWMKEYADWIAAYPSGFNEQGDTFWEWVDLPPDPESYRPAWTEEPSAYQYYETTTEGTPLSPVCRTFEEMRQWLIENVGLSLNAASDLAEGMYAPSALITSDGITQPGRETIEAVSKMKRGTAPAAERPQGQKE